METDRKRVSDLRNLAAEIKLWHEANGTVPAALGDLLNQSRPAPRLTDLETGVVYEFHSRTGAAYELCAQFSFDDGAQGRRSGYPLNFWEHRSGRGCFVLDASKAVPY